MTLKEKLAIIAAMERRNEERMKGGDKK